MKPSETATAQADNPQKLSRDPTLWIVIALSALCVIWFYGITPRYGRGENLSVFQWLYDAWNGETDYEHGILFPFAITGLLIYGFKSFKAVVSQGSTWGLAVVILGVLFYLAGYRTLQPRISAGSLPLILWGSTLFLWGWGVARLTAFPLFFFWLAVPLPSFQQATTQLQLLATSLAHQGSNLFGIETHVEGTTILPVKGNWEPLNIAHGCSGIRSLMALLMISSLWAYMAKISIWKKVVLCFAAFPLAILGNAFRIVSIFVIAEHGDAKWARTTWHDWSGLLLFYPFSLVLLLMVHSILEGGLPWNRFRKRELKRSVVQKPDVFHPPVS